jgi:hypothetical protein
MHFIATTTQFHNGTTKRERDMSSPVAHDNQFSQRPPASDAIIIITSSEFAITSFQNSLFLPTPLPSVQPISPEYRASISWSMYRTLTRA